jgi:hypothetical protein
MKIKKPIAHLIQTQIQYLDDEEQTSKQAYENASSNRIKQKAQLLKILDEVECEGLNPNEIRFRAMIKSNSTTSI